MPSYLLTFGDSVNWGQGLAPEHKFSRIVARHLRARHPDLIEHMLARSGAIIGAGATVRRSLVHGEVPVAHPGIIEQLGWFLGDPDDVRVVLVNGGLYDVGVQTILNPFVPLAALKASTYEHGFDSMRLLLLQTVERFPNPSTRIVVTSYYPIVSRRSAPFRVARLLLTYGVESDASALVASDTLFEAVAERALQFWQESTEQLHRAVAEVNAGLIAPRVVLADAGFTPENATFADDPWLWGLDDDLSPQDEVIVTRRDACDSTVPWHDVLAREQCYRASVGHPNVRGARAYADAIVAALA